MHSCWAVRQWINHWLSLTLLPSFLCQGPPPSVLPVCLTGGDEGGARSPLGQVGPIATRMT